MDENIYKEFQEEMILRDHLAADRTLLANERTMLAYVRTGIALLATGTAMINIVNNRWFVLLGYLFIIISPFLFISGLYKYIKIKSNIRNLYK